MCLCTAFLGAALALTVLPPTLSDWLPQISAHSQVCRCDCALPLRPLPFSLTYLTQTCHSIDHVEHCTLRRYADVIVHRLLGAALALSVLPATIKDPQALRSLADNLNNRHRNAQFAGRASVELYTLMYFKDRTILADARITKVCTCSAEPADGRKARVVCLV